MTNKEDIVKAIQDSIVELENKVSAYDYYVENEKKVKRRKKVIYALECALPYIISSFIGSEVLHQVDRSILNFDEIKYYENVQENLCSNGLEYINRSTKESFSKYFFTSTPWVKDEFGNYTREEVYYSLDALDSYDIYELLEMSDDELRELFPIVDKKMYVKNVLSKDDLKYDDDLVFISRTYREYDEMLNRTQTFSENLVDIVIFLIITIVLGMMISKIIVRHRITDKINVYLDEIKKVNIKEYRELLKIRQDNLNLLEDSEEKDLKRGSNEHGIFHFTR